MAYVIDYGENHESKIEEKGLSCPKYSGYSHLAVFMKWAYNKDMISDYVYKFEPRFKEAMEGKYDLREVIANSVCLKGTINSIHFKEEFLPFVNQFYKFNGEGYPSCVDDNALHYFGEEKYNSDEFKDEAYLFVPYDDQYYKSLSKYIDYAWENRSPKLIGNTIGKEKLDYIIQTVKSKSETDAVLFSLDLGETTIFSSKLGGYPYWPSNKEYPTDSEGNKLVLLAQINLKDVSFDKLPKQGMLQFFIARNDDLGLFEDNGFKVVYHAEIDEKLTEDDVKNLGIKSNIDLQDDSNGWFPTDKSYPLRFNVGKDYLASGYDGFDDIVDEILKDKYGYEYGDDFWWDFLDDNDVSYIESSGYDVCHKMFGYPMFTQSDPRCSKEDIEKYDTLLFQLDSQADQAFDLLIGDCGIINFFINSNDLKELRFDDVLYNWDCC